MLSDFSHNRSQSLLRQRNMLLVATIALGLIGFVLAFAVTRKDREVVLQPILSRPMAIASSGVSADYLELVTRDVALMLLNRTPSGLDYWMQSVLSVVHPKAYGDLRAQLVKIVNEQKGADLAQAFTITRMSVDPKALTSDVSGQLTTFVGKTVILTEARTYHFGWAYSGLSLSLVSFGQVDVTAATRGASK